MATDEIKHAVSIELELSKVQTQLRTLEGNFNSSFSRVGSAAKNLAGILGAGLGLVALTGFLKSSFDEFEKQEQSLASLNQTLQSTGQNVKGYSEFLQKQASALQQVTTFGDDAIVGVQQQLIAFGAAGLQMDRLTRATLDLAAGMGIDLKSAAQLVGKAVAGEFGTFSRYGIIVDDNASKSEKFAQVLKQIEERFGGQAQAQANTFTGAIKQLGNAWGEAKEALAGYIASFQFLTTILKGFTQILINPQGFALSAELEVVNRQIQAIDETIAKTQGNQGVRGFLDRVLVDEANLQGRRAEFVRRANELKAALEASQTITPPANLPGGRALSLVDPAAAKKLQDELKKVNEEAKKLQEEGFKGLVSSIEALDEKGVKASEGMLTVFDELNKSALTPLDQQIAQINAKFDDLRDKAVAFGDATKQNVQPFLENLAFFRSQELLKIEPDVDLVDAPPGKGEKKSPINQFEKDWKNLEAVITSGAQGIRTAFQGVILGTQSIGQAFSNLAQSVALSAADMAFEILVLQPLLESLKNSLQAVSAASSSGGGGGGGGIFGTIIGVVGSFLGGLFGHSGGLVTSAGIMKMHGGGEIPAILQSGEFVMRRQAVDSIGVGALANMNKMGRGAVGGVGGITNYNIDARGAGPNIRFEIERVLAKHIPGIVQRSVFTVQDERRRSNNYARTFGG